MCASISNALLVWCPGQLVEKDIDTILCDGELEPLNGEPNLDIVG